MPQSPKKAPPKTPAGKTAGATQRATSAKSYKQMNFDAPSAPQQREAWSPPKMRPDGLLDFSHHAAKDGEAGLAGYAAKQREVYLRNAAELDRALAGDKLTPQLQSYKEMRDLVAKTANINEKMRIVGTWRAAAIKYDYDQLKAGPTNDKHRSLVQAINGGQAVCDELGQLALHALDVKDASYVFYRTYDADAKTGERRLSEVGHATVIAPNGDGISMLNVMGPVARASTPDQRIVNTLESASRVDKLSAASGGAFSDKDGSAFLPGYSFNKDGYTADPKSPPARIGGEQIPDRPASSVVRVMPGAHEKEPLYTKVFKPAADAATVASAAHPTPQARTAFAAP